MKPVLDELPSYTWVRNGMWHELIDQAGRVVSRRFILIAVFEKIRRGISEFKMRIKVKFGFYLLRQCGDPCPHCGKFISMKTWSDELRKKETESPKDLFN